MYFAERGCIRTWHNLYRYATGGYNVYIICTHCRVVGFVVVCNIASLYYFINKWWISYFKWVLKQSLSYWAATPVTITRSVLLHIIVMSVWNDRKQMCCVVWLMVGKKPVSVLRWCIPRFCFRRSCQGCWIRSLVWAGRIWNADCSVVFKEFWPV